MFLFYRILTNILFVIIVPFLPFVYFFSKKRRANLLQRFGVRTGLSSKRSGEKRVWIHALSVGEVISAAPFVRALKGQYKNLDIVFTVSTKTGFDMADQLFFKKVCSGDNNRMVDQLGYFPFDLNFSIKKIIRRINPDAVCLVETDLWPNFLYEIQKRKIPVIVINARLSTRSLKGYLLFKNFSSLFFSSLTAIMAQTSLDKQRFERLGVEKGKISVVGNIKFDQAQEDLEPGIVEGMKDRLGIQKDTKVLVAGSTHEGEEKILYHIYKKMKKRFPEFLMILAPRDPERCPAIQSRFLSNDVQVVFFTAMDKINIRPDIILVDKMGELSQLYAVCDAAFIGGSMVKQGGHNPLEPAVFSKPILFGSDMSDFLLISTWLLDHGGAKKVESEQDLEKALEEILENRQMQEQMGRKSYEIFSRNSGAVQKIIEHMERLSIV